MMDIDVERLKTDADYWLKSDPSDGEATHFEMEYAGHECAWVRVDRKDLRHYFLDGGWVCADMTNDDIGPVEKMISRPTKPAAPEWVDGCPPVGCECEARYDTYKAQWYRAYIIGTDGKSIIGRWREGPKVGEFLDYTTPTEFRPLRTKEQREREELEKTLKRWHGCTVEVIAGVLIDNGWTRENQDD